MRAGAALVGVAALVVALTLEGCGGGGGGGDQPTPAPDPGTETTTTTLLTTATTTTTVAPPSWKLNPVEVVGGHLFDSVTKKRFNAKGLCMPNVGEDVSEWVKVLHRIRSISTTVNLLRIYELPTCWHDTDCFEGFMREADKLGFYVLVPGTGSDYGYLPGPVPPDACGSPPTDFGCYHAGGVLGWGQFIIRRFNYPNVLAIVIGNEFDQQMCQHLAVIKAYARDLRDHMNMCNTDPSSLTLGQMRMIPLMYASSDANGDLGVKPKADYLFCDDAKASVDLFGLNIERYCDDKGGHDQYAAVNQWVTKAQWPGAFMFSEDGCSRTIVSGGIRTWSQTVNFFTNFPALAGFSAYVYNGNQNFDMFDSVFANATMNQDGQTFFNKLQQIGVEPPDAHDTPKLPTCPTTIPNGDPAPCVLGDYKQIEKYDTGTAGMASNCPPPYDPKPRTSSREIVF